MPRELLPRRRPYNGEPVPHLRAGGELAGWANPSPEPHPNVRVAERPMMPVQRTRPSAGDELEGLVIERRIPCRLRPDDGWGARLLLPHGGSVGSGPTPGPEAHRSSERTRA